MFDPFYFLKSIRSNRWAGGNYPSCFLRNVAIVLGIVSSCVLVNAEEISPEELQYFENRVRPLLAERCFECHGEHESKGGLRLDSKAAMLLGGESGQAIVPGDAAASLLSEAIHYQSFEMPPDAPLTDSEIAVLDRWIDAGAAWPGHDPAAPLRKRSVFDESDRQWWAIQPVVRHPTPETAGPFADWPQNEIDYFVLAQMIDQGLSPAPAADKLALVRRVYLDVIGLPPTPQQVQQFVADPSPDAYQNLVDRLLESDDYGRHAAQGWLDLVRYADSDGYRADDYRPNAWRYRDYVIQSMNDDKPYDQFVREQIAADELYPDDPDAQIALGYLRHWVYEWNIRDARTQWSTILEDVTDTTADVFLGLGLQCAKCHNHKFDPLLQKDYFRLQAFFAPLLPTQSVVEEPAAIRRYQDRLSEWERETESIRQQIAAIEQPYREKYRNIAIDRFPEDLQHIARKPLDQRTPLDIQLGYLVQRQVQWEYDHLDSHLSAEDKDRVLELRRQLKAFEDRRPAPLPEAMTIRDVGSTPPPTIIPKRSSDDVLPGIPSLLDPDPMPIEPTVPNSTGRRAALARWLTDPANPLVTRVAANRVWQSHFGRGLVANASDFGRLGGPPTHPKLLDWLASQLVESGWSLKALHRKVLLSATYCQSSNHPSFDEFREIDPENRWYWRRDTLRMTAEQIRDALLAVSGQLREYSGGPGRMGDADCRSIYVRRMRNSPDPLLGNFDFPQLFSSNSARFTTTTAVQSLMMINSDLMLDFARKLASDVSAQGDDLGQRIDTIWQRVYSRSPTTEELQSSMRFVARQRAEIDRSETEDIEGLIATGSLPYRDGRSIKITLDESPQRMSVPHDRSLDSENFTIEVFFQLRSIADSGAVRTLISKWDANNANAGWRFGITGAGSRRKPQTLVLQMVGRDLDEKVGETAIFSDQHVELNTPYYAAASFRAARDGQAGSVTFFLKDLSNDDIPLSTATMPHRVRDGFGNQFPLIFGSCYGSNRQPFDGLIDDVRLVGCDLGADQILQTNIGPVDQTIGYWQFEPVPGVLRNSVGSGLDIRLRDSQATMTADQAALADLCHALLNSNEYLYYH
jgi:hypothetical protein